MRCQLHANKNVLFIEQTKKICQKTRFKKRVSFQTRLEKKIFQLETIHPHRHRPTHFEMHASGAQSCKNIHGSVNQI
jgi:hypothetical protein